MTQDEKYMQRAIDLALLGTGNVAPNPLVGAVIVHDDQIIGEGYHMQYGQAHAEVNAVNSVQNKNLLSQATIYVTLEPCAHYGKTPPCAELLVKHQFKKVVIGSNDPFEAVNGKGIQILENAGIEVVQNCLKVECDALNKRFFTFHQKRRPYIILKWAETQNGFMDKKREEQDKGINWITQPETKSIVHQWRSEESAILVGWKTIANDNASLTVREVSGNNPLRIIIDSEGKAPLSSNVFQDGERSLVFTTSKNTLTYPASVEKVQFKQLSAETICAELHSRNILSLFIEGGKTTLASFIDSSLWDEARVLVGKPQWEEGVEAPSISNGDFKEIKLGEDKLHSYSNTK